jgi:DNA-binding NtrC family response regulator
LDSVETRKQARNSGATTQMKTHTEVAMQLVVVTDDLTHIDLIRKGVADMPIEVLVCVDLQGCVELIRLRCPHMVLLDLTMASQNGMEILDRILDMDPGIDVILVTDSYSSESAVEAIQRGAYDYLAKPLSIQKLRDRFSEILHDARHRQHLKKLEEALLEGFQFEGMVGRAPLMLDLFRKIRLVAPHYRNLLLLGETGTGKELAAKALHRLSFGAAGPFVACNCSSIVESLFESEFFGYVKGAFTGASQDKMGIFEQANDGTLLLDEIGDLPLMMQAKLLRILQNREVQRVGSRTVQKINVRVIAATHRSLTEMVARHQFREDLFHRLSMMEITLPPLRERNEDLALLERHFIQAFASEYKKEIGGLTRRARFVLTRYHWPGNVRELENVLGHACMMVQGNVVDVRDLPERLLQQRFAPRFQDGESILPLDEFQRLYVSRVVERLGNKSQAAETLGVSRATLYRMLSRKDSKETQGLETATEIITIENDPKSTKLRKAVIVAS